MRYSAFRVVAFSCLLGLTLGCGDQPAAQTTTPNTATKSGAFQSGKVGEGEGVPVPLPPLPPWEKNKGK